jgi:hypothetical protein
MHSGKLSELTLRIAPCQAVAEHEWLRTRQQLARLSCFMRHVAATVCSRQRLRARPKRLAEAGACRCTADCHCLNPHGPTQASLTLQSSTYADGAAYGVPAPTPCVRCGADSAVKAHCPVSRSRCQETTRRVPEMHSCLEFSATSALSTAAGDFPMTTCQGGGFWGPRARDDAMSTSSRASSEGYTGLVSAGSMSRDPSPAF